MIDATIWLQPAAVRAIAVSAIVAVGSFGAAAATAPFQVFQGTWAGRGQVVDANGVKERIRCRANGAEAKHGEAMSQSIICASASFRLDIESYVEASGQSVEGDWRETTRAVQGHLSGKIEGGHFVGAVSGPDFTANVRFASDGRTQTVDIQPSGGRIANVRIELERQ